MYAMHRDLSVTHAFDIVHQLLWHVWDGQQVDDLYLAFVFVGVSAAGGFGLGCPRPCGLPALQLGQDVRRVAPPCCLQVVMTRRWSAQNGCRNKAMVVAVPGRFAAVLSGTKASKPERCYHRVLPSDESAQNHDAGIPNGRTDRAHTCTRL